MPGETTERLTKGEWVEAVKSAVLLRPIAGRRTYLLVFVAFWLNLICYVTLEAPTNVWKLAVQQCLILMVGSMGAKLDRLRK